MLISEKEMKAKHNLTQVETKPSLVQTSSHVEDKNKKRCRQDGCLQYYLSLSSSCLEMLA